MAHGFKKPQKNPRKLRKLDSWRCKNVLDVKLIQIWASLRSTVFFDPMIQDQDLL
jgi:hypothetical protein